MLEANRNEKRWFRAGNRFLLLIGLPTLLLVVGTLAANTSAQEAKYLQENWMFLGTIGAAIVFAVLLVVAMASGSPAILASCIMLATFALGGAWHHFVALDYIAILTYAAGCISLLATFYFAFIHRD